MSLFELLAAIVGSFTGFVVGRTALYFWDRRSRRLVARGDLKRFDESQRAKGGAYRMGAERVPVPGYEDVDSERRPLMQLLAPCRKCPRCKQGDRYIDSNRDWAWSCRSGYVTCGSERSCPDADHVHGDCTLCGAEWLERPVAEEDGK